MATFEREMPGGVVSRGLRLGSIPTAVLVWGIALLALGCTRRVKPIDLEDESIPVEARELVADAEDAIAIARAERDRARDDLEQTREWRTEILDRDWPSGAQSLLGRLRELADARVRLEALRVERANERIELAEARYKLITARTAIRQDLAVYDLEPLKKKVDDEGSDVDDVEEKIQAKRAEVAQKENDWWNRYAKWVDEGNDSRSFYVDLVSLSPRRSAPGPGGQTWGGTSEDDGEDATEGKKDGEQEESGESSEGE